MDFAKDDLPESIEWQQKEMVLEFFILDEDLSSLSPKSEVHGGFTLVMLMSSGKLEGQRYRASPDMVRINRAAHGKLPLNLKDSLLYSMGQAMLYGNSSDFSFPCNIGNEEYKFRRKFQYPKLDYLNIYLNGTLAELVSKSKKPIRITSGKENSVHFHEFLREKLKGPIDPVGMELFNDLCPVVLRFDNHNVNFEPNQLTAYKLLKRQFSRWQDGFAPYQGFCMRMGNQKQDQVFGE
ncbi:hypothetical protein Ancab_029920 [Ancistrocladus abbreviatus]